MQNPFGKKSPDRRHLKIAKISPLRKSSGDFLLLFVKCLEKLPQRCALLEYGRRRCPRRSAPYDHFISLLTLLPLYNVPYFLCERRGGRAVHSSVKILEFCFCKRVVKYFQICFLFAIHTYYKLFFVKLCSKLPLL